MGKERQFSSGFGAYAMSPSRLCNGIFLRGLARAYAYAVSPGRRDIVTDLFAGFGAYAMSPYPLRCARPRNVGAGRIATNKPKNALSPFLNGYNHRMCTLNVYSCTGIKPTHAH